MIPEIVHHIDLDPNLDLRTLHRRCRDSWSQVLPQWQHRMWDDPVEIKSFIRQHYPQYWNLYEYMPLDIMRRDLLRFLILHHHGGICADMDYFLYRDPKPWLESGFSVAWNPSDEYLQGAVDPCLTASVPGHSLLLHIIDILKKKFIVMRPRFHTSNMHPQTHDLVAQTTGSLALSEIVLDFFYKKSTTFVRPRDFNFFDAVLFNNRSSAYSTDFVGKKINMLSWDPYMPWGQHAAVLIIQGTMISVDLRKFQSRIRPILDSKGIDHDIVMLEDFDFYQDYSHGQYIRTGDTTDTLESKIAQTRELVRQIWKDTESIQTQPVPHD